MSGTRLVAVLALAAMVVGSLYVFAGNVRRTTAVKLGHTRTSVPGQREARLEERKYVVWYEATASAGRSADLPVPRVELAITPRGGGPPLPISPYGGSVSLGTGSRHAKAMNTVRVPRSGEYVIQASGDPPAPGYRDPAVVLGQPIGRRIVTMIAAGGLALVSAVALLLVLVLGRRKKPDARGATDAFGR